MWSPAVLGKCPAGARSSSGPARIHLAPLPAAPRLRQARQTACQASAPDDGPSGLFEATDEEAAAREGTPSGLPPGVDEERMTEVNVEDFEMPGKVYGEYTPTEYVTFSPDPANTCSHTLNIRINAPVAECYQFISTWDNLAHCCDLIDIVAPDALEEDAALVTIMYKWLETPPLQIMFSLRMHKSPTPNEGLIFVSEDGMPLLVKLLFKEVDGQTEIDVSIDHTAPDLMIHWVGRFDFEDHVRRILRENLNVLKMLLEKELTVDGLLEYYHEHRKDAFFGPTVDGNMDWVPADKDQEVVMADLTPEGREQEVEDYILGCMAMEDLVADGDFVETEQGWASSAMSEEERLEADRVTRESRNAYDPSSDDATKEAAGSAWLDALEVALPAAVAKAEASKTEAQKEVEAVLDEMIGEVVGKRGPPLKGDVELEQMTEEQRTEYGAQLAAEMGVLEAYNKQVDQAKADEQHLDDYMRAADEEQKANEDAARKAGMEQEAWLSAQQDQMKADFDESIAEMAENQGLSSEGLLLSAMAFRREAQETAHTIGVEGLDADGVMYSRLQLLEETVQDVEAEAAAQGLSPQDYLHYGGIIDGVKADKADQLGMSEEAYVELAWDVVRSRARSTPVESA